MYTPKPKINMIYKIPSKRILYKILFRYKLRQMESVYMWDYLNHYPVTRKKVES